MVIRVNGGIINDQTLTGGMRFFKIIADTTEFAWTVSDGSVNLPVSITGGSTPVTTYFSVGNNRPVPDSAAELVLREISKQADIVLIGMDPGIYGSTTEIHIGVSASAFGWGSDLPDYSIPPADADEEQLPTSPTNAATEMAAAINAMPDATVYITTGGTHFTATTGSGTTVMNISVVTTGIVQVGQVLTGGTLTGTATIVSFGTFNGVSGTVNLSISQVWVNSTSVTAIPSPTLVPVSTVVSFALVTVEEVSFSLGLLTYYTLA